MHVAGGTKILMSAMTRDAVSTSSRSTRDGGGASGGFLSKASNSLKRSPSKTHKSQSSNPPPSLEQVFHETQKSQSSETVLVPQKRPDVYRIQTAPLATQNVKSSLKEGKTPQSAVEATMIVASFANNMRRDTATSLSKGAGATSQNGEPMHSAEAVGDSSYPGPVYVSGGQNPNMLYQHIHDMARKRISTLDYFRKAHEGRVFWFNTVHFSRPDLSKFPNFSTAKLSRRATNYLLLGLSIPPVLDVHPKNNSAASAAANATAAYDFLKALNALLIEFETYQQIHPPDGSTASTLSRARIPHMFKRATQATSSRTRRTSSNTAPEIGLPLQQMSSSSSSHSSDPQRHQHRSSHASTTPSLDNNSTNTNITTHHHPSSSSSSTTASTTHSLPPPTSSPSKTTTTTTTTPTPSAFPSFPPPNPPSLDLPNSTLSPSETVYTYLLTPPLPFPPDFYTVFATLCDVLIDAYQRLLALVHNPAVCAHGVPMGLGEVFAKADARLRKLIVGGVVKEFEAGAREGGKREVLGLQRVVLGGLMGG